MLQYEQKNAFLCLGNTITLWLNTMFYCEKRLCTHIDHVIMIQANKKCKQ